jgi:hypothetical protein
MPIVLFVIMFFVFLIKLAAVQMALHGAVSQTVRQAAANIRPAALAAEQAAVSLPGPRGIQVPLSEIGDVAGQIAEWLPDPAGSFLAAAARGDLQDSAAANIGRSVVQPLLRRSADRAVLEPDRLRLSKLSLPDLKGGPEPYLRIEAEYSFRLGLPFTKREVVLRERAEERVWVSDAVPAPNGGADPEDARARIQIVSIEPVPLRPGRMAHVVALTDPGRTVSLAVDYKSGRSVARHLGDASADPGGRVEWTWLVSGNTTPGVWELTVAAGDGARVSRHFVVEKIGR